jgi:hypothetical protein
VTCRLPWSVEAKIRSYVHIAAKGPRDKASVGDELRWRRGVCTQIDRPGLEAIRIQRIGDSSSERSGSATKSSSDDNYLAQILHEMALQW